MLQAWLLQLRWCTLRGAAVAALHSRRAEALIPSPIPFLQILVLQQLQAHLAFFERRVPVAITGTTPLTQLRREMIAGCSKGPIDCRLKAMQAKPTGVPDGACKVDEATHSPWFRFEWDVSS